MASIPRKDKTGDQTPIVQNTTNTTATPAKAPNTSVSSVSGIPIENPGECDIDRDSYVINQGSGALVFSNTTGQQRVQLTHRSGSNIKFDNRCTSMFSPNTFQTLTHGSSFTTTHGDAYNTVYKNYENRAYGNFYIITGCKKFFNDSIAKEYVKERREIAVAQVAPEKKIGGITNNSKVQLPVDGKPDESSGAVEKGNFKENESAGKITDIIKEKQGRLTELEKEMGTGGNIILTSAKHILFQAGTVAVPFDTGYSVQNGRDILKKYSTPAVGIQDNSSSHSQVRTAAPTYESTDTSSSMPFGDITFKAMGKVNIETGSGGFNLQSSGESSISSTGRLALGGTEVVIGSGTSSSGSSVGRFTVKSDHDVFIDSKIVFTTASPLINLAASDQVTIATPITHITKDVHIEGDLRVQGTLTVQGDIYCHGSTGIVVTKGNLDVQKGWGHVNKDITTNANVLVQGAIASYGTGGSGGITARATIKTEKDMIAGSVSLRKHVHRGDSGGTTGPPKGG